MPIAHNNFLVPNKLTPTIFISIPGIIFSILAVSELLFCAAVDSSIECDVQWLQNLHYVFEGKLPSIFLLLYLGILIVSLVLRRWSILRLSGLWIAVIFVLRFFISYVK